MIVRREIEARVLAPFVEALAERFGSDPVLEVLRATIERIAREQGGQATAACGGNDLAALGRLVDKWCEGGALGLTVLQQDETRYDFDVTRCAYAEMYRRLGIPELGEVLSCCRDFAAVEGFNPKLELTRTRTLMSGADGCDFRYRLLKLPDGG